MNLDSIALFALRAGSAELLRYCVDRGWKVTVLHDYMTIIRLAGAMGNTTLVADTIEMMKEAWRPYNAKQGD